MQYAGTIAKIASPSAFMSTFLLDIPDAFGDTPAKHNMAGTSEVTTAEGDSSHKHVSRDSAIALPRPEFKG